MATLSLAQKMKEKIDFKISKKIDPKKFAVYTFVSEGFYKNYNISKVKYDFFIL